MNLDELNLDAMTGMTGPLDPDEKVNANVAVEDIGVCRKRVSIEIPKEVVAERIKKGFADFQRTQILPGFRPGKAPLKLIEKRVGKELREEIKGRLIIAALAQSDGLRDLKALGQPDIDPNAIKMAEGEPLTFTFETEVRPSIDLPNYKGLVLKRENAPVTDEDIDRQILYAREKLGVLAPLEHSGPQAVASGIKDADEIDADIRVDVDGQELFAGADQTLRVEPTRLNDLPLDNFATHLAGAKIGDTRTFQVVVHDQFPEAQYQGKTATVAVTVKGIRRILPAPIEDLMAKYEVSTVDELRNLMLELMENSRADSRQRVLRHQITVQLLKSAKLQLPQELADRYADQILRRKALEAMRSGSSYEEVNSHIGELTLEARYEATAELAMFFILDEIANIENLQPTQDEINSAIYAIARRQGSRFDRVREQLTRNNQLDDLATNIREQKVFELILENATFEDVSEAEFWNYMRGIQSASETAPAAAATEPALAEASAQPASPPTDSPASSDASQPVDASASAAANPPAAANPA